MCRIVDWLTFFGLYVAMIGVGVNGANILACISSASQSHHIIETTVLEELANRGHNVTVLSTFPASQRTLPKTYHHIFTQVTDTADWSNMRKGMLNNEIKNDENQLKRFPKTIRMIARRSSEIVKHEAVQDLIKSGQKFDLFILGYNLNDMMLGLAGHFRVPSVIISTIPAMKPLRDLIGNPAAVSSAPLFQLSELRTVNALSFRERLGLFIEYTFEYFYTVHTNYFVFEEFYDQHFRTIENFPTFAEIKKNVSLIMTNTHFSEGTIRPALPNLIEIGGIHIKEKPDPLPKNIQNILDASSENGVIVFSFGGNIQSADMTEEKIRMFYNVFAQLKQNIIWKWESNDIPAGKPANVYMMKWLPQVDLLAQPQVRFFISHCGTGGVYEAKFHGVPILGMPIYGDQLAHAKLIKSQGWTIILDFDTFDETTLRENINELLTNTTYKSTARKFSQLFRDRPMTPLQTAIYWIEYVIRYDGAKHMQSSAVHLNFIQKNSLDIILLFAVIFYIILRIAVKIILLVIRNRALLILAIAIAIYAITPLGKSE